MASIYKLKKSEYKEGAEVTFQNAQDLIKLSEEAAKLDNFGAASALSVLALEEVSKAIVLKLKSLNNNIPINNLDKFFTCHETKQKAAFDVLNSLRKKFKDTNTPSKAKDSGSNFILLVILAAIIIGLYFGQGVKKKGKRKKNYLNTIKENGFYVGYNANSRKWLIPKNEITSISFKTIQSIFNPFFDTVKLWIFDKDLKQKDLFELLELLDSKLIDKKALAKLKRDSGL